MRRECQPSVPGASAAQAGASGCARRRSALRSTPASSTGSGAEGRQRAMHWQAGMQAGREPAGRPVQRQAWQAGARNNKDKKKKQKKM